MAIRKSISTYLNIHIMHSFGEHRKLADCTTTAQLSRCNKRIYDLLQYVVQRVGHRVTND